MVFLVGGWPCKGTSRARDTGKGFESRPGLADKNSALFWQLPRIRRIVTDALASTKPADRSEELPFRYIIENVIVDAKTLADVNQHLGVTPLLVDAAQTQKAPSRAPLVVELPPPHH